MQFGTPERAPDPAPPTSPPDDAFARAYAEAADWYFAAAAPRAPIDYDAWANAHVRFGSESPFPGPYDGRRFPMNAGILKALQPDHPARVVVDMKSAQLGGTVLGEIFVGGSMDLDPGPLLYVHPTDGNAARWSKTKWQKRIRQSERLRQVFGNFKARESATSTLYQETRDGRGEIIIAGANSDSQLSMISVSRQVQDDLAKWQVNAAGDPEEQADSRSQAFAYAKILKIGTPRLEHSCRITKNWQASTQNRWHVPCPHCGAFQPLEWEAMEPYLDPQHPERAHFVCAANGCVIEHHDKERIVALGRWVAGNPGAAIEGFYRWTAYSPLQSWSFIAERWWKAKGNPSAEETFWNDVVGRAFKQAGEAPPWEELRDRAKASGHVRGRIPPAGLILAIGVDVQGDRVEWHAVAFGRDLRRWTVDYGVIPGHIADERTQAGLDALLAFGFADAFGGARVADMLAIDGNYEKATVLAWAKRHAQGRVIVTRGVAGDTKPEMWLVKEERSPGGVVVRWGKRFWNVGVDVLKAGLYANLKKADPLSRSFVGLPQGLPDEFFKQLCAERRVAVRDRKGFTRFQWQKDPSQRNEVLDTALIAEAAAIRLGWKAMGEADWDRLSAQRARPRPDAAPDLFDPTLAKAAPTGDGPKLYEPPVPADADTSEGTGAEGSGESSAGAAAPSRLPPAPAPQASGRSRIRRPSDL